MVMVQNAIKVAQIAVIRRLLLVILSLSLLSQNASAAHAADAVILGMAGFNFSFLPFHVAMERGFYQKHGLSVKPVLMRSQAAIPALVSGDIDYATHFGSIVRAAVRGLPMRVILSTADRQMFSLVVQPEIKTLENLKGKIIGVSSFGGTQQTVTVGVLRAVGIDPERDVKIISIGGEEVRVQQLRSKLIQAAMINPPMSVIMRKDGFRLLLHAADYMDLPLTGLGTTTKKIKENPDQVRRILRALYEAMQFIRSNRKETVAIFAKWVKMDSETAADTYDVASKVLSVDGLSSDTGLMASIDEARETGNVKGSFTPRDVADLRLLRAVVAEYQQKK